MLVSLPVRVQGRTPDGAPWEEMTISADASHGGTSFRVRHPLALGQVLLLSLPLPKSFRRYDLSEPSYRVYGLVRDLLPGDPGRVGVMFLGKHPPRDWGENPAGRYLLASDPPPASRKERRQRQRLDVTVNFRIRRTEQPGASQEELTIAENIGKGGARVLTSMPVAKGEILEVEELGGSFRTRAEIRNVYIGSDKVPRLNLRFLDAETPDRIVSAR
jgi:hypothetical protein